MSDETATREVEIDHRIALGQDLQALAYEEIGSELAQLVGETASDGRYSAPVRVTGTLTFEIETDE
jgi:hypothetical protein